MKERIQKVMAAHGLCSRRAAEAMIKAGRVKVNGHPVKLGDGMDDAKDALMVDGETVRLSKKRQNVYIMMNKPRGYLTTARDDRGRKTVMELLDGVSVRVYPVGRLDKDSEGLLLFTNDGAFANLLTHPGGEVAKHYNARYSRTHQVCNKSVGIENLPIIENALCRR